MWPGSPETPNAEEGRKHQRLEGPESECSLAWEKERPELLKSNVREKEPFQGTRKYARRSIASIDWSTHNHAQP